MFDNATKLQQAIDQVDRLVAATPPEALSDSTPCEEFNVAELIEHLTVIANRVATAAGHELSDSANVDGVQEAWKNAHAVVTSSIRGANPAAIAQLPFGTMPLVAAFGVFIGEFTTHGWDLAVALGRADLLDTRIAEVALDLVTTRVPDSLREHTPFGDVVAVAADAPVYDRLAGWMGRDPEQWR